MNCTVEEIVEMYFVKKGYDGLYNNETGCSCLLDNLFPCECFHARNCKAGYKRKPPKDYEGTNYWIGSKKEI